MCQSEYFSEFQKAVSAERLKPYLNDADDTQAFALYLWNIALCESFYPCFNGLEIALRNSLHISFSTKFGTEFWFIGRLKAPEDQRLQEANGNLHRLGITSSLAGDIVASLSLGFWVDLLKGRYEQVFWPALLPHVFPFTTKKQRYRERLYLRLANIRKLRNRVFHHEPIWHLPDLPEQHRLILETIGWISPAMLAATKLLDRFDSVYTRGSQPYTAELETIAQNWNA